jgi:hypothetical protein
MRHFPWQGIPLPAGLAGEGEYPVEGGDGQPHHQRLPVARHNTQQVPVEEIQSLEAVVRSRSIFCGYGVTLSKICLQH